MKVNPDINFISEPLIGHLTDCQSACNQICHLLKSKVYVDIQFTNQ